MSRVTHGQSKTRLYRIWSNMKQRCYNPKANKYSSYGGKGVTICEEWRRDFLSFYSWSIENGYSDPPKGEGRLYALWNGLTIDRIDSRLGYSPSNCRWIPFDENRNRRAKEQ